MNLDIVCYGNAEFEEELMSAKTWILMSTSLLGNVIVSLASLFVVHPSFSRNISVTDGLKYLPASSRSTLHDIIDIILSALVAVLSHLKEKRS